MAALTLVMPLPLPTVSVAGIGFTVASKLAFRAAAANDHHLASMGVIYAPRPRLGHGLMPTPNGFVATATSCQAVAGRFGITASRSFLKYSCAVISW